jgi:ADP-heptose:LPS heptosyltransferase
MTGPGLAVKRVVVIKTRALGDTLLATPALRALRKGFPRARLTAVVSPAGREVLVGNPGLDDVWVYDKRAFNPWTHLQFLFRLRRAHFDLGVALHATWRTAFLLWAAGIPRRVVNNHSGKNFFATIPIPAPKISKSARERDLDAVRALGVAPRGLELELRVEAQDRATAKAFLKKWRLYRGRYFVLVPGAGKERKRWTAEAAAAFLKGVRELAPAPWVLLAGPGEQALAAAVNRALEAKVPVFCGSLKAAAVLLAGSRGVVTTDSGPKHVAVAMRARTLTLWTDEPEGEWHPYDPAQHALLRSPSGTVADITPVAALAAARKHFHLNQARRKAAC